MMYIEAPDEYTGGKHRHFMAGGISNCPNWQNELAEQIIEYYDSSEETIIK